MKGTNILLVYIWNFFSELEESGLFSYGSVNLFFSSIPRLMPLNVECYCEKINLQRIVCFYYQRYKNSFLTAKILHQFTRAKKSKSAVKRDIYICIRHQIF